MRKGLIGVLFALTGLLLCITYSSAESLFTFADKRKIFLMQQLNLLMAKDVKTNRIAPWYMNFQYDSTGHVNFFTMLHLNTNPKEEIEETSETRKDENQGFWNNMKSMMSIPDTFGATLGIFYDTDEILFIDMEHNVNYEDETTPVLHNEGAFFGYSIFNMFQSPFSVHFGISMIAVSWTGISPQMVEFDPALDSYKDKRGYSGFFLEPYVILKMDFDWFQLFNMAEVPVDFSRLSYFLTKPVFTIADTVQIVPRLEYLNEPYTEPGVLLSLDMNVHLRPILISLSTRKTSKITEISETGPVLFQLYNNFIEGIFSFRGHEIELPWFLYELEAGMWTDLGGSPGAASYGWSASYRTPWIYVEFEHAIGKRFSLKAGVELRK